MTHRLSRIRGVAFGAVLLFGGGRQLPAQHGTAPLPLHEVPSLIPGTRMAILLTGDGDWAAIDKQIAAGLAAGGVSVVGLESRRWLTNGERKDPAAAGRVLAELITTYGIRWRRDSVLVIGYSRGAELAPFAVARLPEALRARVLHLTMLGPSTTANFTFHLMDLVRDQVRDDDRPLLPEVGRLRGIRLLCIQGSEEKHSLCPLLPNGLARVVVLPGGHHFDQNFGALAARILEDSRTP